LYLFNPLSANVGHARHDADVTPRTGKIIKNGILHFAFNLKPIVRN